MASKQLTFDLYGRDKTASSAIRGVGETGERVRRNLARVGVAVALATAAAVAGILATSVKAAAEAQKVAAQTEAVIKSTGGAAERTTNQIAELADELARMSGIDDELIQSGANVLLTFTKIRGVNFDRATRAVLDLSVALKMDMQSAAILVGKALNDPIKGIASLSRSGVQFSEDQKKVIKALVETGQTAKAQEIILEELNTQFGKSAEAFGSTYEGTLGRFQVAIGNLQEKIGEAFLPVLSELVDFVGDELLPIIEEDLVPAFQEFADWLAGDGKAALKGFITFLVDNKDEIPIWAGNIATLTAAVWLLNIAMDANPVGAFIAGIGLVATGVAYFTTVNRDAGRSFTEFFMGVYGTILDVGLNIATFVEGLVNTIIGAMNTLQEPLNAIRSIFNLPPLRIGNVDLTSGLKTSKQALNTVAAGLTTYYGSNPSQTQANAYQIAQNLGLPGFASGGIVSATPGGIPAIIGEGRWDEAVIPLSPQNKQWLNGGGGVTVEIINNGGPGLMEFIDARIRYNDGRSESILVGGKVPGK